ncbi:integrase [Gossypium australe]|uniref:Integrase n=1 Tax=Gossypium australe TaxID=47621 RepID=A0A5B6X6H2_9ROSI|nr:integrase [Gossypium australe]
MSLNFEEVERNFYHLPNFLTTTKVSYTLCWTELKERKIIGLELVQETEDKIFLIQERLKTTSDRQKSYAKLKKKEIEFNVGEQAFLKIKSIMCSMCQCYDAIVMILLISFPLKRSNSDRTYLLKKNQLE